MTGPVEGLRGRRILVAEDEYMIAEEIENGLGKAGAEVVGPVSRVGEALAIVQSGERLDGAVLDVNLANEMIWPVVKLLAARGVPVVLATGYDAGAIPAEHIGLPYCQKPLDARVVVQALARSIAPSETPDASHGP